MEIFKRRMSINTNRLSLGQRLQLLHKLIRCEYCEHWIPTKLTSTRATQGVCRLEPDAPYPHRWTSFCPNYWNEAHRKIMPRFWDKMRKRF